MRAEIKKGTREGAAIAEIVNKGDLVPYELTVQVLLNALISNPSKQYLIDGFPRALDQALHFETMGCECQSVLYFNVDEDVALERGLAEGSDREDCTEEAIRARITTYNNETKPVIDFYNKFGKVYEVDANKDVNEVYAQTRSCVLPQV